MMIDFFKDMNDLIIESLFESSDQEILLRIGVEQFPNPFQLEQARENISRKVGELRAERLKQMKSNFEAHKTSQSSVMERMTSKKSVSNMLLDIVKAMQNADRVPNGLLVAFREQGQGGSDQDIKEIWRNLVELGLIDNDEDNLE